MTEDDLIAAIAAAPDELEPRLAYARWLVEQGDPLGPIALVGEEEEWLAKREQRLFDEHRVAWLGELRLWLGGEWLQTTWKDGFIDAAVINAPPAAVVSGREIVRSVVEHPSARLLRDLHLAREPQALVDALVELERPRALRRLVVDGTADVSALWRAFPQLDACSLYGPSVTVGVIDAPELRRLYVDLDGGTDAIVAALCTARAPKLVSLELGHASDEVIEALLEAPIVRQVEHVDVLESRISPQLRQRLPGSA